jgi:hypothetical protein
MKPTLRYQPTSKNWICRHGNASASAPTPSLAYKLLIQLLDRPVKNRALS